MSTPETRTWLITGCDKGIGYAVAEAALRAGDSVAVTVLAADGKSPLAEAYPGKCRAYHLNVTNNEAIRQVVTQVEADFGRIDVLLNNAGFGLVGAAEEVGPDEYRTMFEVNLFGTIEVTRAVIPGMRNQRSGHILSISSLVGFVGAAGFSMYASSKFAIEGFMESIAKELAPFNIKATVVEPGAFRSDFAGGSMQRGKTIIDDYEKTSGATREFLKTRHGTQPGDPSRLGDALVRLTREAEPPVRIPLGSDCLTALLNKVEATKADFDKWRELTLSTNFVDVTEQKDMAL